MAKSKDILTTGEVARICKVAPRTVSKWFDSGHLGGYRIPGSKDRRIPWPELRAFMDKHGMPLNALELERPRALIVGNSKAHNQRLEALLAQNKFEIQSAESAFAAGVLAERLKPQLIIWNLPADARNITLIPGDILDPQHSKIIALTTTDQQSRDLQDLGFHACLAEPLDDSRLAGLIEQSANRAQK